ncbi:hypothetical protein FGO68_gene9924 [Halteria grandinella]|uniref:Uncharacterized protein n=1 Tax=Halteria grandinella TaxID=5974 RepID=A0A8J8NU16_HALGN|nr:hypothetical protein FGO68_gene9924 [Halteria grandinella]
MAHNLINSLARRSFLKLNKTEHYPVLYREVHQFTSDYLSQKDTSKSVYQFLDCTFGGGNHSVPLLEKHQNLRVLGLDLDSKVMNEQTSCIRAHQFRPRSTHRPEASLQQENRYHAKARYSALRSRLQQLPARRHRERFLLYGQ